MSCSMAIPELSEPLLLGIDVGIVTVASDIAESSHLWYNGVPSPQPHYGALITLDAYKRGLSEL